MERIKGIMKRDGIDYILVTSFDEHFSEYTDDYYHDIAMLTGFTGDSALLIITKKKTYLWTDSRYFLQAENETDSSEIVLMREGIDGVPYWYEWLKDDLLNRKFYERRIRIAFDGKRMPAINGEIIQSIISECLQEKSYRFELITDRDIPDEVWKNRPKKRITPVFVLDIKYSGKPATEKLQEVRSELKKKNADYHLVSSLDNIAWLLNLRADDIVHTPVFEAFLLLSENECILYTDAGHFEGTGSGENVLEYLNTLSVSVKKPEELYADISKITGKVLLDKKQSSFASLCGIKNAEVLNSLDPEAELKCIKNETEIANLRKCQLEDSIAFVRFMYYFKNIYDRAASPDEICEDEPLTECSAAGILHEFRTHAKGFLDESFETISAYGKNAAIVHYMPDRDSDTVIDAKGLFLVDSGGQYYGGTTDITRTFSAGKLTDREKEAVTLCVIGNLRLADSTFEENTPGSVIDHSAREPLLAHGYDFGHGTGHGVGCFLNVHEDPVRISPKASYPFKAGMYVSNEPGIYITGEFGVRIENMLLCRNLENGQLGFEIMTLVPFDPACIDFSLMTESDLVLYNEYQHRVYYELQDRLNDNERNWLKKICFYTDSLDNDAK